MGITKTYTLIIDNYFPYVNGSVIIYLGYNEDMSFCAWDASAFFIPGYDKKRT